MGNAMESSSGQGALDHIGEAGDMLGTGASIVQAADVGAAANRGLPGSFLSSTPVTPYGLDEAGNLLTDSAGNLRTSVPTGWVNQTFNGIGAATGALGAVTGGLDFADDTNSTAKRAIGFGNLVSGTIGTASSIAGMGETSFGITAGLAQTGGAAGMGGEAFAASTWGAGAMGGTGATVGTALATGGAVLGAGLAGLGLGMYADEHTNDTGWFQDAQGRNQSMTDETADAGVFMDELVENGIGGEEGSPSHWFGDVMGDIAGLTTVAVGSGLGTLAAPTIAAHGIGSAAIGGMSSLWNWARGPRTP